MSTGNSQSDEEPTRYWIYSSESDDEWRRQHSQKYSMKNKIRSAKRKNLPTPLKARAMEWLNKTSGDINEGEEEDEAEEEFSEYLREKLCAYHEKSPESNPTTPLKAAKMEVAQSPKHESTKRGRLEMEVPDTPEEVLAKRKRAKSKGKAPKDH